MKVPADRQAIIRLFESIQSSFPHLTMKLDVNHPHVDLNMDIPRQKRKTFASLSGANKEDQHEGCVVNI